MSADPSRLDVDIGRFDLTALGLDPARARSLQPHLEKALERELRARPGVPAADLRLDAVGLDVAAAARRLPAPEAARLLARALVARLAGPAGGRHA